ncbi:MAG: DUF5946 family protein [Erythrobacter sp.]
MSEVCFSCGGVFAAAPAGTTHVYMAASPGCWGAYTAVLAREYQDAALFSRCHRLTVDAYAVQHPGDPDDRRARQSFWIHGASLWMVVQMGRSHRAATAALKTLAAGEFPVPPAPPRFALTTADVLAAHGSQHEAAVRAWAEATLADCAQAHAQFEMLALRVS